MRRPRRISIAPPMNPISILLLSLAMSTDAFAAAVCKGSALHRPSLKEALRTGLIFGTIEGITPVVGWAIGIAAADYVRAWDHWIAFVMLGILGLRMMKEGLSNEDDTSQGEAPTKPQSHGFWLLVVTGFATSIDAMAVGAGLALVDVQIAPVALDIGATTMLMVTLGVLVGRVVGPKLGKRTEVFVGLLLIAIGSAILYEHLSAVGV